MQQVKLENGEIHNFPDDATPDEMNSALSSQGMMNQPSTTTSTFLGQLPTPNNVPEFKSGTPEQKLMINEMISAGTAMPGMNVLNNGLGFAAPTLKEGFNYLLSKIKGSPETPVPTFANPEQISNALHQDITQGATKEEAGQKLAGITKNVYDNLKAQHSNEYNSIFNKPIDESIFGEPMTVGNQDLYGSTYLDNYKNMEMPTDYLQKLHDSYLEYPTLNKAHELQSELGSEIGSLKFRNQRGNLDSKGQELMGNLANMRDELKGNMSQKLGEIDPNLQQRYQDVTKSYEQNIIPFHADTKLKDIAQGRTTNPTSQEIVSIFKNPEPSMKNIVSYFPDEAKDYITHIGGGFSKNRNSLNDVMRGMNNIDNRGLNYYVNPYHQQNYLNLLNNKGMQEEYQKALENSQESGNAFSKAASKIFDLGLKGIGLAHSLHSPIKHLFKIGK